MGYTKKRRSYAQKGPTGPETELQTAMREEREANRSRFSNDMRHARVVNYKNEIPTSIFSGALNEPGK